MAASPTSKDRGHIVDRKDLDFVHDEESKKGRHEDKRQLLARGRREGKQRAREVDSPYLGERVVAWRKGAAAAAASL